MNRFIWFFGEPGSGKKKLINDIIENKNNVREMLNINSNSIAVIGEMLKRDDSLNDHFSINNRIDIINEHISKYINAGKDTILIIGHYSDINGVLKTISNNHPNVEQEIVFLNPADLNVLYERFKNTEWFKSDSETNERRYPREWIDVSTKHLQKELYKHEEYGYTVTEIDTTDGYIIKEKDNQKIR